jgi:hypothetical protein
MPARFHSAVAICRPYPAGGRSVRSVRREESARRRSRELLAGAAAALPGTLGPDPMLSGDLHITLYRIASDRICPGDSARAHRLADRAEEALACYLIAHREIGPGGRVSGTLRNWLAGRPTPAVARALLAASAWGTVVWHVSNWGGLSNSGGPA